MSIWIRSQDMKRLRCCDDVELLRASNGDMNRYKVIQNYDKEDHFTLGTYHTEQRALEVMDEIQEHICGGVILPYLGFGHALFAAIGESEKDDIAKKAMADAMGVASKLAVFQMPSE